jgi:molecular chaperone GrpE
MRRDAAQADRFDRRAPFRRAAASIGAGSGHGGPHGNLSNFGTLLMANTPPNDSEPKKNATEPGGGGQGAGQPQDAAAEGVKSLQDVVAALQAEVNDLKDKWLRANAEVDNIRKRAEKEHEDAAKYAITKLALEVVNVGDNFQRAIDAVPAGAAERDQNLKSFLEGVTMTERELLNALDRHGIKRLQPMNEAFNPHLHQAVTQVPRADVPSGTIVEVYQAGYTIADRVLRPAMVGVAQGGPKATGGQNGSGGGSPPANENTPPPAA